MLQGEDSGGSIPIGKRAQDAQWRKEFQHNFGYRSQLAGLSQADVCRAINDRIKDGWKELKRFELSRYANGKQTPKIPHLKQIAEVLGCEPSDLIQSYEGPTVSGGTRMALKDVGNGRSLLDFRATITSDSARKILEILASDPTEAI